ncbi:flp pilus-assembly TadE/G-like family protein [Mycolicibacterium sp. 3033]|nr:flp pilus-assembly TadE/G-like family protein [Mycolicibacterium aurantiacum]
MVAVIAGGAVLGSVVVARHRAAATADLAALSAAAALPGGGDAACATAASLARSMASTLVGCDVDGLDVLVTAEVAPSLGAAVVGVARATARAGPQDTAGFTSP